MTFYRRTTVIALLVAALFVVTPQGSARAESLAAPQGDVVLTVSGAITHANAEGRAEFDMDMLKALQSDSFVTTTIWTEGEQRFEGVGLDVLLARLGVDGGTLVATAINDYAVDIPVSDATVGGPMIAYMRNGDAMSVRDKGPLWIVYPYDKSPDYRTEVIYSRSIWQLDRITVAR